MPKAAGAKAETFRTEKKIVKNVGTSLAIF